jgi:hypothetical protein
MDHSNKNQDNDQSRQMFIIVFDLIYVTKRVNAVDLTAESRLNSKAKSKSTLSAKFSLAGGVAAASLPTSTKSSAPRLPNQQVKLVRLLLEFQRQECEG